MKGHAFLKRCCDAGQRAARSGPSERASRPVPTPCQPAPDADLVARPPRRCRRCRAPPSRRPRPIRRAGVAQGLAINDDGTKCTIHLQSRFLTHCVLAFSSFRAWEELRFCTFFNHMDKYISMYRDVLLVIVQWVTKVMDPSLMYFSWKQGS